MNKLKLFYDRIIDTSEETPNVICMTPSNNFAGKRYCIRSYEDLENAVKSEKVDLYFTYNHQNNNYKKGNSLTKGFSFLALDVESANKIGNGCVKIENLQQQFIMIRDFLKHCELNNYTLICSGNGFHLYLHLGSYHKITDREKARYIYKESIKAIADLLSKFTYGKIKADDRVDIGGILRVPHTINSKTLKLQKPRQVSILEDNIDKVNENNKLLKFLFERFSKIYDTNARILDKYPQTIRDHKSSRFFQNLLYNKTEWDKYCHHISMLGDGLNENIIMRLGRFVYQNPSYVNVAKEFINVYYVHEMKSNRKNKYNRETALYSAIEWCKKNPNKCEFSGDKALYEFIRKEKVWELLSLF